MKIDILSAEFGNVTSSKLLNVFGVGVSSRNLYSFVVMPPTLKKWGGGGHIGFGLSVCMYVRMYVFMFEISS